MKRRSWFALIALLAFLAGSPVSALAMHAGDGGDAVASSEAPCHDSGEHETSLPASACHLADGGSCQCAAGAAMPVQTATMQSDITAQPCGHAATRSPCLGITHPPLRPPSA